MKMKFLHIFLLLILVIFIQGPSLNAQFMIDDFIHLNRASQPFTFQEMIGYFVQQEGYHYNPLDTLVNRLMFHFFSTPLTLKLVHLGLFFILGTLIYLAIQKLTVHPQMAFLTAAIYLTHWVSADYLAHITFCSVTLSLIFLMLALILILEFVKLPSRSRTLIWLSLGCFLLAVWLQEKSLLFPVLLYFLRNILPQEQRERIKTPILFFTCFTFILGLFTIFMMNPIHYLGSRGHFHQLSLLSYLDSLAQLISWYLGTLCYIKTPVMIYSFFPSAVTTLWGTGILFLGTILALLSLVRLKSYWFGFGLAWFLIDFIFLFPASLVHLNGMGMVIEPYWFSFSLIGFTLMISHLLMIIKKKISVYLWISFLTSIFLLQGISSYLIHTIAKTEVSYLEHWLKTSPKNVMPLSALTSLYSYEQRLPIPQEFLPELQNQIKRLIILEHYAPAIDVLKRFSNNPSVQCLLYALYIKTSQPAQAEQILNQLRMNSNPQIYHDLVQSLINLNLINPALSLWEEGITRYPNHPDLLKMGEYLQQHTK